MCNPCNHSKCYYNIMSVKSENLLLFISKSKKWYLKYNFSRHLKIFHRINNGVAEFAPLYIHSFNFFKINQLKQSEYMNIDYYKIKDKPIGDKIRFYRLKNKLTQKKAAEMLGIDKSTYIKIECDKTVIDFQILKKLSAIFKTDILEIIDSYHYFIYYEQKDKLKNLRHEMKITQKQLADILDVGVYTVKRWESEETSMGKKYYEYLFE